MVQRVWIGVVGLVLAVAMIASCGSSTGTDSATVQAPTVVSPSPNPEPRRAGDDQVGAKAAESAAGDAESVPAADTNVPDLPDRGPHPGLEDIDGWINAGDVESLDDLKGNVIALQFWTFSCSNCKATLPHVTELQEKYGDQDFVIVGVHAPEFDFEADPANIEEAMADLGVTWPVALDTQKKNFHGWQEGTRSFWPRMYLIDRDGHIRYDHIGEGRYDEIDAAVGALLAEA